MPRPSDESGLAVTALLVVPLLGMPAGTFEGLFGPQAVNIAASILVFIHGICALRIMWKLEKRDGHGLIPFAWSYFAVQHLAFGFGGVLLSVFDRDYYYENDHGSFAFGQMFLPLLLLHFASMNIGLAGVWTATRRARAYQRGSRDGWFGLRAFSWHRIGPICISCILLHGITWLLVSRVEMPGALEYVLASLKGSADVGFVLWGLFWRQATSKWLLLAYTGCFALVQIIIGNRAFFMVPVVLFSIGLLSSGFIPKWDMRVVCKAGFALLFLMWIFVKSEDIRNAFDRDDPTSAQEAMMRVLAIGGRNTVETPDANGVEENGLFRVGARLYELSAMDVSARTPSVIPFWGWNDEDWSVLTTAILPMKLNPDAGYFSDQRSGCFFLRSYGFYVDPFAQMGDKATTMPATLLADTWRRFGWPGLILWFAAWSWSLARASVMLRVDRMGLATLIFGSSLLVEVITTYTFDATYLVGSIPRRLIVVGIFTAAVWVCDKALHCRDRMSLDGHRHRLRPWPNRA